MHQKSAQAIVDGILSSWLEHEVTPNGDEATFLTQGLSTYIQYLILDQVEPEWKIMDQFVVRELQRSLANATLECGTISALERSAGEICFDQIFQNDFNNFQFFPFLSLIRVDNSNDGIVGRRKCFSKCRAALFERFFNEHRSTCAFIQCNSS